MSLDDPLEPAVSPQVSDRPVTDDAQDSAPAGPSDPFGSGTYDPTAAMAEVVLQTRRAIVPALVIGVLALVVGLVADQLVAAVGVCLGLGLGMANARMLRSSVQRRFEILVETPGTKTHFLSGGALRLGLLTLVTLLACVLYLPLGFGIIIGLAAFQITLLVFAGAAMLRSVRT